VRLSWAGPLERFAKGIAEAIKDFCEAQVSCPVAEILEERGVVENISPKTAPALIKRIAWELNGVDFTMEGRAADGTLLSVRIQDEKLVELKVSDSKGKASTIEADVSILELDEALFHDLPLNKKFEIVVRRL